ncbi:MAG: hypothetical protein KatS3mg019_1715 [Fimbriimonadales bacterium]|nr:MAG: hypothetical protein KatS3mg019_1715 [Fimbriimonadales bacterium]
MRRILLTKALCALASFICVPATVNAQGDETPRSWYLDRFTEQAVSFSLPFVMKGVEVTNTERSTRFVLSAQPAGQSLQVPENSVFILEFHTKDLAVIYAHNFTGIPGVRDNNAVNVIRRRGAVWITGGTIHFNSEDKQIVVEIPTVIQLEQLIAVVYRYLPDVSDLERVSGQRPPMADYLKQSTDPFTRLPGWPYYTSGNNVHQQRRAVQSRDQSRQQPGGQQRRSPRSGGGRSVPWQPGTITEVPIDNDSSSWNDPRFQGGDGKPWPRDISVPSSPNEPGVQLPDGKIVNWGFEHGPLPFARPDRSDAWVGIIGEDDNRNGRLDPEEVEGVIGLCPPDGSVNNFYIDEQGYVHWENRKKGHEDAQRPDLHYIYDPSRNILKIYDSNGNLIYIGPPENWNGSVR